MTTDTTEIKFYLPTGVETGRPYGTVEFAKDDDGYTDNPTYVRIYQEDTGDEWTWHIDGCDSTGHYTEAVERYATEQEALNRLPGFVREFLATPVTIQLAPIVAEEGAIYTPFTDGWGIGYEVTAEGKPTRWVYLYPSQTDSLGESNVFVYLDGHQPTTMQPPTKPECYVTIWPTD